MSDGRGLVRAVGVLALLTGVGIGLLWVVAIVELFGAGGSGVLGTTLARSGTGRKIFVLAVVAVFATQLCRKGYHWIRDASFTDASGNRL